MQTTVRKQVNKDLPYIAGDSYHRLIVTLMKYEAAAAAKSLQPCLTLCDPCAHQAPPSLGFSRQEHWSGLLFPSLNEV